ncbi:MAG TPA: CHAT domain-containing tetratricopeptide repeat protein [Acetobacteraceae bacterium]|nr:CHAT domain-containing tetratricopeptide repeat protein [Acetobacteraceae bacterium]
MRALPLTLLLLAMLAVSCATPPPSAFVGGSAGSLAAIALGKDASGDACHQLPGDAPGAADIFCGTWQEPAAMVRRGPPGGADALTGLATTSAWRQGLDRYFICAAPTTSQTFGHQSTVLMQCTRRIGGWPQVAIVASVDGGTWMADGILPTLPVIERSIGVLSGRISASATEALPPSAADALLARTLAARAFSANDASQFDTLMTLGLKNNLAENFAASEQAYRAALVVQQRALGADNPNTADALMDLALQVSNQGRYVEADGLFTRAATLAPRAADPAAPARLLHYRALDALNQGKDTQALALLRRAEAGYAALVPPELLHPSPVIVAQAGPAAASGPAGLIADPTVESALMGALETRRYQAIVLRHLGHSHESAAIIDAAQQLARADGIQLPVVTARLTRTAATTAGAAGQVATAVAGLAQSAVAFSEVLPETRPLAETRLLQAAALARQGDLASALALCREATGLLRKLASGTIPALLAPCLAAYHTEAARQPADAQKLLAEMFETAELAQDSLTTREISQAAARLAADVRDPKVAAAIRRQQDASQTLATLYQQRDALAHGAAPGTVPPPAVPLTPVELDQRIAAAEGELADADAALQAAAPNYGQLVQQDVPAGDVLKELRPNEAFVAITLAGNAGWVFLMRGGRIDVAPLGAGTAQLGTLVHRIRASIEPTTAGVPEFDTKAAYQLYQAVLAPVAAKLAGAKALVVAPSGPLLSLPFAVLLTGPGDPRRLREAPWLIREMSLAHVPSAANFVALRRIGSTSRGRKPWFGFGDFHPVTLAQAERTFPTAACADSAQLFAGLPPLPFAQRELTAARELLGGSPVDELLGAAFTVPAVEAANLRDYRVLHFATHALLPTDLRCEGQPAIVTSAPPRAVNASGALLTTDDVVGLKLDADLVILSACNTGGPGDTGGGDSLSGLARAFFFAGARALLVTHWSISDQSSAYLVADTLARYVAGHDGGLAGSLRATQLGMLKAAGTTLPAALAHPFYWAPFALIGEGAQQRPPARVAMR